jgi:Carboxypeptidase regulatory-like domain/TonB-dependent Receptor Plug Domain
MHTSHPWRLAAVAAASLFLATCISQAQSATSVNGTVVDPSGAVVPQAVVEIHNPVSGFARSVRTDALGQFSFPNVPFNPYHLTVTAAGFSAYAQDVEPRSSVPVSINITLHVATEGTVVDVRGEAGDLTENDPSFHTDVDKNLFDKVPLESQSSSLSSLVTLTTPGVVADSNGLFHGLGDHADNSFSYDGQPITDQQSKVFSNQIPPESIQSMEVISGAVPAEFGDKTSVIVKVTTRSGQGVTTPHGSVKSSYGSFGTSTVGFDLAYGGPKWGNFIAASGLNTGRFLDPPELHAIHDKGNEENLFDRIDFQPNAADSIHVNLGYSRSWFQTPNSYDNLNTGVLDPITGGLVGPTDQRSQINTYNIAPVWTHLISPTTLFTFGGFVRHDDYNYYPSANVFADGTGLIPGGSSATVNQHRTLTNMGLRSDLSYVKGIHNLKAGVVFEHTLLRENFNFGITDPALVPSSVDANGNPCFGGGVALAAPCTFLLPIDLTRGGSFFPFRGRTDIKQLALYVQDTITKGSWAFSLGLRGDLYRGIVRDSQLEPRIGIAYNVKKTNSVIRVDYSRIQATPYNENLILSSLGSQNPTVNAVFNGANSQAFAPIRPGFRNQFNAGFQQAFGRFLVVDADVFWKYTHNGYDFSIFGSTPITFPIAWHNSKLNGVSVRANIPEHHGLSGFVVLGHTNARYFPPQIGGLGATVVTGQPFRIDHDQKFQQTTHLQYQPRKTLPWVSMNWRYDSGLVASNPNLDEFGHALAFLDADQQTAVGLFCVDSSGVKHVAALNSPLNSTTCNVPGPDGLPTGSATKIVFPKVGTFDLDHNPTRIAPRHLFDAAIGDDNLFHGDHYQWSLRFTVVNLTNKTALYNFLSTFSGTHFVTPRTYTAELGFHF